MKGLIERLSKQYNITQEEVKDIIQIEFEFIKKTMKKVDSYNDFFPYIRLANLGVFKVKEGKQEHFRKKSKKILEDVYTEQRQQSGDRAEDALDPGV